jgi:hypothetical protein
MPQTNKTSEFDIAIKANRTPRKTSDFLKDGLEAAVN